MAVTVVQPEAARDDVKGFVKGLGSTMKGIRDPRVVGRCHHLLFDIIAIAILATFCGADDWPEIEAFGQRREPWLRTFLKLPNGIPSHDTFERVLSRLERHQFAAALFGWLQLIQTATEGRVIAVDGKTMRRSGRVSKQVKALHLVTAWAAENRLVLGLVAYDDKSNEITAIPELLRAINLKGATVTIDAMGCQKEIAAQIREQKGHYFIGLKGNQPKLQKAMQQLFDDAVEADFAGSPNVSSTEKGHGRIDERIVHAIRIPREHPQRELWRDLNTLVSVTSRRETDEGETWETRFYISSHLPKAKKLAAVARLHWGIENSQHHVLDVAFHEDERRQADRTSAVNLASLRRLAVSVLRQDTTNKRGVKNKRLCCALDPEYLVHVLSVMPPEPSSV